MPRRRYPLKRLIWPALLALSLCWSLLHGLSLPGYSQVTPTNPREEVLIEEIKEDVARHLEIRNAPLDHSSIRDLYFEEAEAAGLTYEELIDLYETEYAAQKAGQAPNPWEQYLPNAGWLVGLAGLAIAAYVTLLKTWFEARLKAIGDWIYNQLSGTRLFRGIALRKYRDALADNYKHLPMPFLRNRAPLSMAKVYVPLKVSETREEASAKTDPTAPQSHELLDAYKAIAEHRRLMVIGEPGSGKSVLLKHLAWSYGQGELDWLADRPVVVLLELYRLSDADLDETKLLQALADTFSRNQFPNAEQFVQQMLKRGTLMLLLDGLDEVSSDIRQSVVQALRDFLKTYRECRVVITCRTAVYSGEFTDIADRKLEVVEFTDQQIQRFLKAWETDLKQARKSVGQLMAALRERPLILKLARNPLLLTLVAYLYAEPGFVLPRSRADFYQESTRILLDQREFKGDDEYRFNRYEANEKRRVLEHLALYIQEHRSELSDRRSLPAATVRTQIKQVLPSLDIAEEEAGSVLAEIIERSGLLMEIDGGDRCLFPHLTLQEFFAATALKENEAILIERFRADPAAWREVVKLWCSLANDSTTLVKAVYERDILTGFESLAEARKVDQTLADEIIDSFKPLLDQPQTDDTVVKAFGAVATNERDRGKAVFNFLEQTLSDSQASDQQVYNAADALSRTNLTKAAEVLLRWYEDNKAIIRMGNLAVPGLAEIAKQGNSQAVDDLFAIHTPQAAVELANLLWYNPSETSEEFGKFVNAHNFPGVAHRAAWYLAGMLPNSSVKEGLKEAFGDDTPGWPWLAYGDIEWIWQSFEEKSFISVITGRIAYLLTLITPEQIPQSYAALDPRIVVPLCMLYLQPQNPPQSLTESDESLLEAQITSDVLTQCRVAVNRIFERNFQNDEQWKRILSGTDPVLQLDIINRLTKKPQPRQYHWRDLFKVVNYDLKTGWHYQAVLAISVLLSLIAVIHTGVASISQLSTWYAALFVGTTTITIIFWLTILGSSHRDPMVFKEFGIEGVLTFQREYQQLLRKNLVWSGLDGV
jgi:energy-coupling factor transporter ATP-binding protein EcfA2